MQLMFDISPLEQLAKPRALRLGIGREVEDDGDTLRQESANMWRKGVLQARRALYISRYVSDSARKQGIQKFILHEEDRIFSFRQISRESRLARRHFAAEEDQLR